MLRIRNLAAGYGKLKVLKQISMHVASGEIVTIIGANGAGKTTLLSTIAGLVKAASGEIVFKGKDLRTLVASSIPALGCVMVPEGRQVFASMSVEENLQFSITCVTLPSGDTPRNRSRHLSGGRRSFSRKCIIG